MQECVETGQEPDFLDEENDFRKLLSGDSRGFFKSIIKFNNRTIKDPLIE